MALMRIKKGDNVIVLSGKDKGKDGKVLRLFPATDRVVVEGVNIKKRRTKPRKQNEKGQTIEAPAPMHLSNVALRCAKCKKGVRTKTKIDGDKKSRICASCGSNL